MPCLPSALLTSQNTACPWLSLAFILWMWVSEVVSSFVTGTLYQAICVAPCCGPTHQFCSLNVQLFISTEVKQTHSPVLWAFLPMLYILLLLARTVFCFSWPTRIILFWLSLSLLIACKSKITCPSFSCTALDLLIVSNVHLTFPTSIQAAQRQARHSWHFPHHCQLFIYVQLMSGQHWGISHFSAIFCYLFPPVIELHMPVIFLTKAMWPVKLTQIQRKTSFE